MIILRTFTLLLCAAVCGQVMGQYDLRGSLADEQGHPIQGGTIWIYTAAPRVGPGFL